MRRNRTIIQALIGATVIAGGMAALTPAAQADTTVACDPNPVVREAALVKAINDANLTPAADTVTLASGCIYTLTSAHGGPTNGLPLITTPITMITSPATVPAIITRSSGSSFRIAEVSPTGGLTLTSVALTNGKASANGNASGDGGGILNHGAVTLTDSSLSGNTAGGNGGGLANVQTPSSATKPAATFTRSPVSNNTAVVGNGGGIYNGLNGTLTTTGAAGTPMLITGNTAIGLSILGITLGGNGGGIAAVNSTATTLTNTAVTTNHVTGLFGPFGTAGGVYRQGGTMTTTTTSPITANTPNNCLGSNPAVPNCTG